MRQKTWKEIMKKIKTEQEYKVALKKFDELTIEVESISLEIRKYENFYYKIDAPHPIEAIKFRMEQEGLKQKDMIKYIGNKSKVSEVLSKKIKLSINMVRKINKSLGIPFEILMQDYKLDKTK